MNTDKQLFPPDQDWLTKVYRDLREIVGSSEYFYQYLKKRFPHLDNNDIEGIRNHFIVDQVDVCFVSDDKYSRRVVKVGYGSSVLQVLIPDNGKIPDDEKEKLRNFYQSMYFSRLKESHIRVSALLWYMLPDAEKDRIKQHFPEEEPIETLNLFADNGS